MNRHARLLLGALALLAVAWVAGPTPDGPPLYDGLGFPDEPYRYIAPPAGAKPTKPAATGSFAVKPREGVVPLMLATSAEKGPQVEVQLGHGSVVAGPGATQVRLTARPLAPYSQPKAGTIWGNVYRVQATTNAGPAQLRPAPGTINIITLRAPSGPQPMPAMHFHDGTRWHRLKTTRVGNDIYQATARDFGDYALVRMPEPEPESSSTLIIIVLGGSLIVLVGLVLLTRAARRRESAAG